MCHHGNYFSQHPHRLLFAFAQGNGALLDPSIHRNDWRWHQATRRDPMGWGDYSTQDARATDRYIASRVEGFNRDLGIARQSP